MNKITIMHLYPDLLNLYGDKGNIYALTKRLKWRGIEAEVVAVTEDNDIVDINSADIVFLGGGTDKEQETVLGFLRPYKNYFKEYVSCGGVILATCGGFSMLGNRIIMQDKEVEGLGIVDIETTYSDKRLIGNIAIQSDLFNQKIVGFENHWGRVDIKEYSPLGTVVQGYGNNESSKQEGLIYKNVIGTNLHGPLLPKNPRLCDYILECALKNKCEEFKGLEPLNDEIENMANEFIVNRLTQ